jgi:hypothetical protein
MASLFRRPSAKTVNLNLSEEEDDGHTSAYLSLLDPVYNVRAAGPRHRRTKSSPGGIYLDSTSRPWLAAAETSYWTGADRPPTRKLVKDPTSGSPRPLSSVELSGDDDGDKKPSKVKSGKGTVKRQIERLRELYRSAEKA